MKTEFFIAYRHLIERKFQTIIAVLAVAISLIVFIVSLSVSNGLKSNFLNSLLTLTPSITLKYDINTEDEGSYLQDIEKLKQNKEFINIKPIFQTKGIVKHSSGIDALLFEGTDLKKLDIKLIDGEITNNLDEVIIGSSYAENNNISVGDIIDITTETNKKLDVKVGGIFKTGYYAYDSQILLLNIETLKVLMDLGDKITSIGIDVQNKTNKSYLDKLTNNLQNEFSDKMVYNWTYENQNLLSAIEFEKFVLVAILSFLIIITSFVISVILYMIVREKTSDIGILKSFGYDNKKIRNIFLIESVIISISGMILSFILIPIILVVLKVMFKNFITSTYYLDTLPIKISFLEIIIIYIVSFLLTIISTILPANKASKMKPNDAIKYNN